MGPLDSIKEIAEQIAEARKAPPDAPAATEGRTLARIVLMPNRSLAIEYDHREKFEVERAMTLVLNQLHREITMETHAEHLEQRFKLLEDMIQGKREGRIWTPGEAKTL